MPVALNAIPPGGVGMPVAEFDEAEPGIGLRSGEAVRARRALGAGISLESLILHRASDVLLVSFHGLTDRSKYTLPRFEWLRTVQERTQYSALFLSDPTLSLDTRLSLGWYTGPAPSYLPPLLAEWISEVARIVGASRSVLFGTSGGGYAALQTSSYLPESLAVPMNPQTAIAAYRGGRGSIQKRYVETVVPHLGPYVDGQDWSLPLADRASAVRRYAQPQPNWVYYVQNVHDTEHVGGHLEPFRVAIEQGPNRDRVRFVSYEGPHRHEPPSRGRLLRYIEEALEWHAKQDDVPEQQ